MYDLLNSLLVLKNPFDLIYKTVVKMQSYLCVVFMCIHYAEMISENNTSSSIQIGKYGKILEVTEQEDTKHFCKKGTLLSSSVCVPDGYLKGEVPETPTVVRTRIEINNILEVNDKKMRITLDFYQELLWVDNRIKIRQSKDKHVSVLNNNLINQIWKPDLWIKNLFDFKVHGILEPTGGLILMGTDPSCVSLNCTTTTETKKDTLVTYNMEAQATIHCNFYFVNYPMDTQYCEFVVDVSYPYPDIVNLSFELGYFGVTHENSNVDDFSIDVQFEEHINQTGIHAAIRLKRCLLPFIIKCYLPCIAINTVSLISFLISVDSKPARVGLLVTQFLTITNILMAQQVTYLKAVLKYSIYLLYYVCMLIHEILV